MKSTARERRQDERVRWENVVNESLLTNLVLKFVSDNAVAE